MKTMTKSQERYYQEIADYISGQSDIICKLNHCTENDHFCESYAYFDYDKKTGQYSLADICGSDYASRCYASYIALPYHGNAFDLFDALENELLKEYWD